jgi:hypothetical protein
MMTNCKCDDLPISYEGKKLDEIFELKDIVRDVRTDFKAWETEYICTVCNQTWLEYYKSRGHSEIPMIKKVMN